MGATMRGSGGGLPFERSAEAVATAVAILRQRFGERVATGEAIRRQHASTLTWIEAAPPDAVVWALSEVEVVEIVQIAAEHRVPIVPFGAGTSLEGHVNAPYGGLSLDLSRMDRVLSVAAADLDCTVEPGVTRKQLNTYLRDTGLFFAVDPGAGEATLGGMAATRASGTNAVRYGTMRDNVVRVRAVLADGSVISTGGRARKSAAGYDLTRLIVGSEGTLGIVTELTLRLHPVPETVLAAVCPFPTVASACNAAIAAIQLGLGLARIELLDPVQIRAVNAYSKLSLAEAPTLFVELHGTRAATAEAVERFREIAAAEGGLDFAWAASEDERRRLWQARHDAYWASRAVWAGKSILATDVCVPISRLAECVTETMADIERLGLTAPIVGHVGDGNFHVTPVFDAGDPAEKAAITALLDRLAGRAIAMEGTCTGEHGIGEGKIEYLVAELGPGVETMRRVKRALDPLAILNPGKIFPPS
jgi:D-lactate dehydrogenase (cytochrome)